MKKILMASLFAVTTLAHAEVKPAGAVISSYCGDFSKSTRICLARTIGAEDTFILFKNFNPVRGGYVLNQVVHVDHVNVIRATGATTHSFVGVTAEQNTPYLQKTTIELRIVKSIVLHPQPRAVLIKNGIVVSEFDISPMSVTQ